MACFLVPAAEAVVTTIAAKAEEKKEHTADLGENKAQMEEVKIPLSRKLHWLTCLLFGGAVLLAFEHVWHGEVVPWFPFLTAAADPADAAVMLHEMSTVGVTMAILVTAVWAVMCLVADSFARKENMARRLQAGGAAR